MDEQTENGVVDREIRPYESPHFEVIPLDCEITAYAPDSGDPLF